MASIIASPVTLYGLISVMAAPPISSHLALQLFGDLHLSPEPQSEFDVHSGSLQPSGHCISGGLHAPGVGVVPLGIQHLPGGKLAASQS